VARAVCEEADVAEHLDEVLAMARNCLASEVVQRVLRSGRWWREVAFVVPGVDGVGEGPEAGFTAGRVDLVFRDGDAGLVVVDYKTDAVGAAAIEGHAGQAETYGRGVGAATGLDVSDVVLVFARRQGSSASFDRWLASGEAKAFLADHEVLLNGEPETRRGRVSPRRGARRRLDRAPRPRARGTPGDMSARASR
jgi:hypothetical protein